MSKDQKGFVVYGDIKETLDELTDEQVATLFRGMVDYHITGKEPKFKGVLKFVFIPLKQQMDRNTEKYEKQCERNRANANKRWNAMQSDAVAYGRIRSDAVDANTNTKTNINTKTDTDTTTTTKQSGGGLEEEFNIWNQLGADGIDAVYEAYPNSGGFLLDAVHNEIKTKKKKVKSPLGYVLGYAKKVGWDDKAEHFEEVL